MKSIVLETCLCALMAGAAGVGAEAQRDFGPLIHGILAAQDLIEPDSEAFKKALPGLWAEMLEYTRTHSGMDLDPVRWGIPFQTAHFWMLRNACPSYEQAEALTRQGLDVLRKADARDPCAPARVAFEIAMAHAELWMGRHTLDGVRLVDEVEEWVDSLEDTGLRKACFGRRMFFEGNCFINRFYVAEEHRDEFVKEREGRLWRLLNDEGLGLDERTVALSHWATALCRAGRIPEAEQALARWWERYKGKIVTARYYLAVMEVALLGNGDWVGARDALLEAGRHRGQWRRSSEQAAFGGMCRLYYENMLSNGYEVRLAGAAQRKKLDQAMRAEAGIVSLP